MRDHGGNGVGRERRDALHPFPLEGIALDGRLPAFLDAQTGKRALYAHRTTRQVDAPNVGGNATRERHHRRNVIAIEHAEAPQRFDHLRIHFHHAISAEPLRGSRLWYYSAFEKPTHGVAEN